jgi:hypothetical protein
VIATGTGRSRLKQPSFEGDGDRTGTIADAQLLVDVDQVGLDRGL